VNIRATLHCVCVCPQVLRRQNSGLSAGGRRSSRLGSGSSTRGINGSSSGSGGAGGSTLAQFETSRLAQQQLLQQQGTHSCRSSVGSLNAGSPVPSLAGTGLSRCGTPLSAQTASAANTPQGKPAGTAATLAGLPLGAFTHGAQLPALPGQGHQSPMHQHPVFDGSTAAAAAAAGAAMPAETGSIQGQHAMLLSLNTWANTPMGEQQSPQPGSPASRASSPSVSQGALLGQAAAAAAAGDGGGSSGLTAAAVFAQQFAPQLQRCMSTGGALTRSTSCGSNLAAAGAAAHAGPLILSLPGVLALQPGTAARGHDSLSGTVSPDILAAAAAAAAAVASDGQPEQQLLAVQGVDSAQIREWLRLSRAPAHLMWRQPQGKLRPLPGHRTHYHSDGGIQEVHKPPPLAPSPAAAAAGSSVVTLRPSAAAASVDGSSVYRTASPGLESMVLPGGASLAPSGHVEASLLALQTKTIKCSMCGVSGGAYKDN
jgi:hypothetical protein